jgi:hypothetical protein
MLFLWEENYFVFKIKQLLLKIWNQPANQVWFKFQNKEM